MIQAQHLSRLFYFQEFMSNKEGRSSQDRFSSKSDDEHERETPRANVSKESETNSWQPSATSSPVDRRSFNLPHDNDMSLRDLRRKMEQSFGCRLSSTEGDIMLKLAIYRQNSKIMSQLTQLRKRLDLSLSQFNQSHNTGNSVTHEELGLPITTFEAYK